MQQYYPVITLNYEIVKEPKRREKLNKRMPTLPRFNTNL